MNGLKPRILCVDDEPLNLSLLEAMLVPRGFEVMTASNGMDALDKIQLKRVDIVLLDVMMPEMDGFEVCRRIKADDLYRNIPVIMITAYAARENRIKGIEAGAEDFISKPFDSAEVLARIGMLLKVKALNDQLYSAYHNITSLTSFGEQLFTGFDPLHFNFMASISDIVHQIIAVSPEKIDHPQRMLAGFRDANGEYTCYIFGYEAGSLTMTPLPSGIFNTLNRLVAGGTGVVWLNQPELQERYSDSISILNEYVTQVFNLICHQSSQITLCALNYGRQVTLYDAEVLNSVVAQSLFLKSLSQQVRETEDAFDYTVHALARASEVNDEDTGNHILRVGEYSALLAGAMGMSEQFVNLIRHQSIMHDVGKIHLSPEILKKPAPLSVEEFELVKQHTILGAAIIGDHVRLTLARSIALCHHERFDGSGYPHGLSGEQIPIEGRILNLADQYDALRNKRCYKEAFDHNTTFRIITEGDGRTIPQHFDPRVLAAFKEIHGRFAEIFGDTVQVTAESV